MNYCHIEFQSNSDEQLQRTIAFFDLIKRNKSLGDEKDESALIFYLTEQERNYFWNPSKDEQEEYNSYWFSTPIEIRHSSKMLTPQWHLESMLDAFWCGYYELLDILSDNGKLYLTYNPYGYPYGGVGCMIAMLESFGNTVIGVEDGTGYEKYIKKTEFWMPKKKTWKFWKS